MLCFLHFSDKYYYDGIDRRTFIRAVEFITVNNFKWPQKLNNIIQYEYTNWSHEYDPVVNRKEYIDVSFRDNVSSKLVDAGSLTGCAGVKHTGFQQSDLKKPCLKICHMNQPSRD